MGSFLESIKTNFEMRKDYFLWKLTLPALDEADKYFNTLYVIC